MKNIQKSCKIFWLLTIFLISNCANYKPFTKSMIKEYALSAQDLKSIQYYISDQVILTREVVALDKEVTGRHSLKKVEDKFIEEIVFKEKTPGILVSTKPDLLNIAFEKQGHITFKEKNDYYTLLFEKTDEIKIIDLSSYNSSPFIIQEDKSANKIRSDTIIEYQNNFYHIFFPSDIPYLLVDEKSLENIEKSRRTVEGMRLPKK